MKTPRRWGQCWNRCRYRRGRGGWRRTAVQRLREQTGRAKLIQHDDEDAEQHRHSNWLRMLLLIFCTFSGQASACSALRWRSTSRLREARAFVMARATSSTKARNTCSSSGPGGAQRCSPVSPCAEPLTGCPNGIAKQAFSLGTGAAGLRDHKLPVSNG